MAPSVRKVSLRECRIDLASVIAIERKGHFDKFLNLLEPVAQGMPYAIVGTIAD